jgi:DNA-binding response OmpR family regulator
LPTTAAEQVNSSIRQLPNSDAARGTETILVAEDDPGVRSLIHDVLVQLGYTVHTADGLAMAVSIARAERIDLLLTDVVLPGTDGPHIRDAVNEIHPVPCLFMTGHADDRLGHHGIVERGVDVLRKPFTVTGLSLKVRQVLDSGKRRLKNGA